MIKLQLFSIKDHVVGSYMRPFTAVNEREAQRMLSVTLQSDDNKLHHHPDDFSLYYLGDFDQVTGVVDALPEPTLVVPLGVLKRSIIDGDNSDEQA